MPFPPLRASVHAHNSHAAVRRLAASRFVSTAGTNATGVAIGAVFGPASGAAIAHVAGEDNLT